MLMSLLPLILIAGGPVIQTDTSFSVPEGSRLALHNFAGKVIVRPGPQNVVRIQAVHARPVRVFVSQQGASYEVRTRGRRLPQPPVDYWITAPAWMSLDLEGFHCDMDIEGWKSDVLAETVRGGVRLLGGEGLIRLSSMTGGVDVRGARGRMQLSSVESRVGVHDAAGEISVDAVNGDVVLDRVRSRLIEAATVSGNVQFTGWIDDAGRYRLATHRGNLDVLLPPEADATVWVSTFSGGFESAFPVRPGPPRPGRSFSFTLGDGRALMDLQSFEGRINLRQGEMPVPSVPAASAHGR
jgi:hypothetical protein